MKQLLIPCIGGLLVGKMIVDLFAGLGGASHGIEIAVHRPPDVAVNHCAHAIALHKLNHPATQHYCDDIRTLNPREVCKGYPVGLLWMSPDCRHFSKAKGKAPVSESVRALAWEGVTWAAAVRPDVICLENIPEFLSWGPLDPLTGKPIKERMGETFAEFVAALRDLGYVVDWRVLCARDYGAPTIRNRLYLVARCDGLPIGWPKPSHGPGCKRPWLTAPDCIEWDRPCRSIFARRARPLAEASCRRIAAGIVKYVLEAKRPYLRRVPGLAGGGDREDLVSGFIAKNYTGVIGQAMDQPLGTVTTIDHHSLVTAQLVEPAGAGERGELVAAFLTKYYGSGGQWQSLSESLHTVVTRSRYGLVLVRVNEKTLALGDVGMRMLSPRELARAQGFPETFQLAGTQEEQIARVGNSVCPPVAAAVVGAQFGTWPAAAAEAA